MQQVRLCSETLHGPKPRQSLAMGLGMKTGVKKTMAAACQGDSHILGRAFTANRRVVLDSLWFPFCVLFGFPFGFVFCLPLVSVWFLFGVSFRLLLISVWFSPGLDYFL